MSGHRRPFVISSLWPQAAVLTFVAGFAVLGILAWLVNAEKPPMADRVVVEGGGVLYTGEDVIRGQHVFQKYGLMQFGTLFGHGAYLGPDFTALHLHRRALSLAGVLRADGHPEAEIDYRVRRLLEENRWDPQTRELVFSPEQAAAFSDSREFYGEFFGPPETQDGLRRPHISRSEDLDALTAYFSWAAWTTTARRPGLDYSYTNNWPAEPLAGNRPTADALLWSALSLIALLGGLGVVFYLFGRYDLLGWHRREDEEGEGTLRFRPPEEVRLTPSQRAVPWYFLVVAGLFLAQGLLGGANAHYHVEPAGFFGLDLARWLPYNLTRMWHVQLALFFVAASFLAMGIFLAPMIAGREPKHQEKLAIGLFGAVVLVVAGSLMGEAAGLHDLIPMEGPWFYVGAQGWEYLDLGRLWQLLLVVGMLVWVVIVARGLRPRLKEEHRANMPWLFLFSAITIPAFYAVGMLIGKNTEFAVADFWRFWVVHLWVEDFLELFTTIMVAYIFVLLGVVRLRVATRIIYLDIILYSVGGVIGTMHHLYFSGAPSVHMALGAFFSAMEVIPLVLLTFEAWRFMELGSRRGDRSALSTSSAEFPHKWAVMFLIAVGFWNFLGAGVFGFLINLPIVSYYEIGTAFTANHGHGAMMGVYGMLAMGFFMFVARYFVPRDEGSERAMRWSFWGLNIGLAWMIAVNLVPTGILQLRDAVANGYWHAREAAFYLQPWIRVIEWLRLPGDVVFIGVGIVPAVYLAFRMFANRNRSGELPLGADTESFTSRSPASS